MKVSLPCLEYWLDEGQDFNNYSLLANNFSRTINELTQWHNFNSPLYSKFVSSLGNFFGNASNDLEQVPFLPVSLFKNHKLISISEQDIFKVLKSSGTTGLGQSRIFLDKVNAKNQSIVLSRIMRELLGTPKRLPMLIIDSPKSSSDRLYFSASKAAIIGFSMYGKDIHYALNDDFQIDLNAINKFLHKYRNEKVFIFGFTAVVWQKFILPLLDKGFRLDFSDAILLHGGGWKKMENYRVDKFVYKNKCETILGSCKVVNYYGMVEQTGSLFMECSEGFLHTTPYSRIIIRSRDDLSILKPGELGLIQLLSILPTSYPGHSILTEDIGVIHGENQCKCGKNGVFFEVKGRLPKAVARGCSDTKS